MSLKRYNIGVARRFVAGNIWCAQKSNQGKLPCLRCRGRGFINGSGCFDCEATGYGNPQFWKIWYKLWVYLQVTERSIDDSIFHR